MSLRSREELLVQIDELEEREVETVELIRDTLRLLHKTNVSKKKIADRLRSRIGLLPGEPVR